jgi:superkiller protein 3
MAWYDRGKALKDLNLSEEALESYHRAIAIDGNFTLAWNNSATLLYQERRYGEALDAGQHATVGNPRLDNGWYVMGLALLALGRREEARVAFDRAIALNPGYVPSVQTVLSTGTTLPSPPAPVPATMAPQPPLAPADELMVLDHVAASNLGYATAEYAGADPVNPTDPAGWYMKSLALYRVSRYQEAIAANDRGLNCNNRDIQLWNVRGLILHGLRRDVEALPCLEYALALDPSFALAYDNKATILLAQGNIVTAVPTLEQATRLDPSNSYGWANLGYALYYLQKPGEALAAFERAAALAPSVSGIHNNQGAALHALGRIEEALAAYDRALAIDSGLGMARRNKARALRASGREAEAQAILAPTYPPQL